MKAIEIEWEDFIDRYKTQQIRPLVDINKGHALMKSQFAPRNWRFTIKILTSLSLLAFPSAIILLFVVKWWIPLVIIFVAILTIRAIRQEAAKAVIQTSLEDSQFYFHAILSGTMKVYTDD